MIHLSRFIMRGKMCLPFPQTGLEWSKIPEWPTNWACIGARLREVIQFKNKGSLLMVPDSSVGKESTCNAGDSSSIPGLGRSTGEGIGFPLQYSWASLVAQLIICLQCGRPGFDPWVGKIPWRRERLPTPVFRPGEFHGLNSPQGRKESDTTEWLPLSLSQGPTRVTGVVHLYLGPRVQPGK